MSINDPLIFGKLHKKDWSMKPFDVSITSFLSLKQQFIKHIVNSKYLSDNKIDKKNEMLVLCKKKYSSMDLKEFEKCSKSKYIGRIFFDFEDVDEKKCISNLCAVFCKLFEYPNIIGYMFNHNSLHIWVNVTEFEENYQKVILIKMAEQFKLNININIINTCINIDNNRHKIMLKFNNDKVKYIKKLSR